MSRAFVKIRPFLMVIENIVLASLKLGVSTAEIIISEIYSRDFPTKLNCPNLETSEISPTKYILQGPLTVVTGKNRRCTFVECPNDISSMIDVAKVADLVLLMVDANFGFEMEIFEFLNIAQVR